MVNSACGDLFQGAILVDVMSLVRQRIRSGPTPSCGDAADPFKVFAGRVRGVWQAYRRRRPRLAARLQPQQGQVVLVLSVKVGVNVDLFDGERPVPVKPRQRDGERRFVFKVSNQSAGEK